MSGDNSGGLSWCFCFFFFHYKYAEVAVVAVQFMLYSEFFSTFEIHLNCLNNCTFCACVCVSVYVVEVTITAYHSCWLAHSN